jgi:lysophospholipase L1-like esterase
MRICFVGDSFTNGTGDDAALGWVGRIAARARQEGRNVTCYNLGIRRDTSADIAARWRSEVERRLPPMYRNEGLLAFSFGTNDCADDGAGAPRLPLRRAVANTATILTEAASFAPSIMIGPLPALDEAADRRVRDLSDAQQKVCARIGVPFLAAFDFVAACEPWSRDARQGDGTHPNAAGYAALADFIWQWPALHAWLDKRN